MQPLVLCLNWGFMGGCHKTRGGPPPPPPPTPATPIKEKSEEEKTGCVVIKGTGSPDEYFLSPINLASNLRPCVDDRSKRKINMKILLASMKTHANSKGTVPEVESV